MKATQNASLDGGDQDVTRVGGLVKDLARGTQRNFTIRENMQAQWLDVEFRAPVSASLRIKTRFSARPKSVQMVQLASTLPVYQALSLSETFRWSWDNGHVVTDVFNGLGGNDTYVVTLLVLAE